VATVSLVVRLGCMLPGGLVIDTFPRRTLMQVRGVVGLVVMVALVVASRTGRLTLTVLIAVSPAAPLILIGAMDLFAVLGASRISHRLHPHRRTGEKVLTSLFAAFRWAAARPGILMCEAVFCLMNLAPGIYQMSAQLSLMSEGVSAWIIGAVGTVMGVGVLLGALVVTPLMSRLRTGTIVCGGLSAFGPLIGGSCPWSSSCPWRARAWLWRPGRSAPCRCRTSPTLWTRSRRRPDRPGRRIAKGKRCRRRGSAIALPRGDSASPW